MVISSKEKSYLSPNTKFFYSCLMVSVIFLITRLPYYIHYPILIISNDTASYLTAAFQLMEHSWPLFDIRTPGYPLFISAVLSLSSELISISLVQSIFTYFSAIFFLIVAFRFYRNRIVYFAIAVCGFISSTIFIILEMSILTEGIFTSLMLVTAGVLMLAVKSEKFSAWIIFSALVALLIYIRPAGLFLIALLVPLMIFFMVNKYPIKYYAGLILPFILIIGSLCLYNYKTLGKFTITPFGEANLAGVTVLFMEPSELYPEFVNTAIQTTLDSIPRREIKNVKSSNNPELLFNTFKDNFHMQMKLVSNLKKSDSSMSYIDVQPYLRQISIDAIKKRPDIYAKFFLCNFYYFLTNIGRSADYRNQLERKYKHVYVDQIYLDQIKSGKWSQISDNQAMIDKVYRFYLQENEKHSLLDGFKIDADNEVTLKPTMLMSVFEFFQKLYDLIFRNLLWLAMFALMLILSIRILIRTKFKDKDALIALTFALIFLLKAILVSMVESSLERYSYTVDFVIYMSLPFALILFQRLKAIKNNSNS